MTTKRIGIVGARGHVGQELLRLVSAHDGLELDFVVSREWAGQEVVVDDDKPFGMLRYEQLSPEAITKRQVDAIVLALPNGRAGEFVAALDAHGRDPVLLDLSADYRFDDGWYYGLPELTRAGAPGQRRIANPGCYATAMQLALAPIVDLLEGPVQCFGVSGYSGAGTTPSDKNDPFKLKDNLMPYSLVGHLHEREVTRHLAHAVEFMPHVAAHFRGITMTVNAHLNQRCDVETLYERFRDRYDQEALIGIRDEAPWVSAIANKHGALVGGVTVTEDGRRAVIVSVLDNLLKGAATQAMQNLNLALGFDELQGILL
jgi:N-acetyl-gamma-glutamyl-phosphate reductase